MKQRNVFSFGDIMGLRRRIKNKIKSIFGSKDNEKAGSSNVMYETPSSPIQSNQREDTEESEQDTSDGTKYREEMKVVEQEADSKDIQKEEINKEEDTVTDTEQSEEEEREEEKDEEKEKFEPAATSQSIDEKIVTPEDSQETLLSEQKEMVQEPAQDISDEKRALQNLFNDEDIEQAVFIYNVSKLDMKHCPNCNAEVFGNWTYEEGKYRCSSCQSVLA